MTWIFGLIGWGGAGALAVAVLFFGWVASKKVLLILSGVIAVALLVWGGKGYVEAASLRESLATAQKASAAEKAAKEKAVGERDTALQQRDLARDEAQRVSDGVAALKAAADAAEAEGREARRKAQALAQQLRGAAAAEDARPASVPGDDLASARDRAWRWLNERKTQ